MVVPSQSELDLLLSRLHAWTRALRSLKAPAEKRCVLVPPVSECVVCGLAMDAETGLCAYRREVCALVDACSSGPGGPGQSPTYQSPGTGAAPEAAEGGAGAQVPKSGEGEEGREAEGQGGGGRTPGSLVLMKETQETGPEIPPGKLIFPSLSPG